MVAVAEMLADNGQAMRCQAARDIHGSVSGADNLQRPARAFHRTHADMLAGANSALDRGNRNHLRASLLNRRKRHTLPGVIPINGAIWLGVRPRASCMRYSVI